MFAVCVDSREASGGKSGEGRLASFPRRYHYRMLKHLQVCAWFGLLYAVLGDGVGLEGQDEVIGDGVGLEGQDEVIDIL